MSETDPDETNPNLNLPGPDDSGLESHLDVPELTADPTAESVTGESKNKTTPAGETKSGSKKLSKEPSIKSSTLPDTTEAPPQTNQDALSLEFLYYGSVLKAAAPTLSNDADRQLATPWIRKLFRPEYQTTKLRDKRNRYLVSLVVNLLNDEVSGIFKESPPEAKLQEVRCLQTEPSTVAEWECDRMWQDTLLALPDDFEMMGCIVHQSKEECDKDHTLDKVLDQEFQFLLYVTRPYAALLPPEDKTRTAAWLQTLCTIHGEACSSMKAIRNDYLMALIGYLHDLRIVGPFMDYPPEQLLKLSDAAKEAAKINPVIDPTGPEANQFLLDQPIPDDGAFCYVALTGDLIASNL